MIYTLTLSPSLDYRFQCESIKVGEIMHPSGATFSPGGKGINVSRCLTELGVKNTALGFIGGWAGARLEEQLKAMNVDFDFIRIDGETRINVKVNTLKDETAFNLDGPIIAESDIDKLFTELNKLNFGDILIMSGSTGRIHNTIYKEIISKYNSKGILCVLDSSSIALKEGIKAKPYLIKPNIHELSELVGRNLTSEEVPQVGEQLISDYGITYILVSLGEEGACLVSPTGVIKKKFTKAGQKVISTVGAGDCLLASFMYKMSEGVGVEECLEYGVCCGAANCYLGHVPDKKYISDLLK
jgi:1-phosphofructokinase